MKKILLLVAAGLIFQVTPVLAQPQGDGVVGPDKRGKMFEKHDTNGDGMVSEAEFLEHAKKKFAEKDINGDGSLSQDEAKAAHAEKRKKREALKEKWKEKIEKRKEVRSLLTPE